MFKRLRERIAEEATKFPVGQHSNNSGKPLQELENKSAENAAEDLITLSDSSSVVVPHTSRQQFSIGEDEDGSPSDQSTPQKGPDAPRNTQEQHSSMFSNFGLEYRPSKKPQYVPQSDIESEREEPPTLNLDGISKDQLLSAIQALKARSYKYKNKYSEVVKNYKELRDEKIKIENALIETQDKGLRRITELREQCNLEQKAKAHLEENLRLLLEEKDSRICVLETQINLLKDAGKSASSKTLSEDGDSENCIADSKSDDSSLSASSDQATLQEKVERLQHQHNQNKKTIKAQTEQIFLLRKQNEGLSQELEEKVKLLNGLEDELKHLKSDHQDAVKALQDRLQELEKQQEESAMSMAETKKNMHLELEFKDKQLLKAEEEAKFYQLQAEQGKDQILGLKKQHEQMIEKLNQDKTATINVMQQECEKKVESVEEKWKIRCESLQAECHFAKDTEVKELRDKLEKAELTLKELQSYNSELEDEKAVLQNSVEKLESNKMEEHHEESLRCLKDKLQKAEKNHQTQMEQLKLKLSQLERENSVLLSEKENLLAVRSQFKELTNKEEKALADLQSKEAELKKLQEKLDSSAKEQTEKVCALQESMKDKENMILKLKANLESVNKEHAGMVDELNKKIRHLELEREQLMMQAQERVSATEAKCRQDTRALQEKCEKLAAENEEIDKLKKQIQKLNSQLDESLLVAESNQASALSEMNSLKERLVKLQEELASMELSKSTLESEMSSKIVKLEQENKELRSNCDDVVRLKTEKEELNEELKAAVLIRTHDNERVGALEKEKDCLKAENEQLSKEVKCMKTIENESISLRDKLQILEENEAAIKKRIEDLNAENGKVKSEILELKASFEKEKDSLVSTNKKLETKIQHLESSDLPVKDYVALLKKEYDEALKAKDDEVLGKLKQLVRDFSLQMDLKDKDSEQMITELMEKNQYLEEKLSRDHALEISALRQDLFEKDCALEEIRDSYEETLKEKDAIIKKQALTIQSFKGSEDSAVGFTQSPNDPAEPSDWDDAWVVPDEVVENASPVHQHNTCEGHEEKILSLQEELAKSNAEIKELKVLLRLSPPETMIENNNRRGSSQSIPEPTEFEYLKNIIYEYMMGVHDPVTLAKVIAAVLRFNAVQTQQVIKREETRHSAR